MMGRSQAYWFPIVASCALLGMFLAIKYLPKDWVSFIPTMYGFFFGGVAFGAVLACLIEAIPSLPLASPVTFWYYETKAGLSKNVLATGLALSAIDMLSISDYQTEAILLSGLFFYDIFWVFGSKSVFGSNVMVSVAKQFEGPIKLVFPQFPGATAADTSMLGLGDIVVPGLFVALMLRFDVRNVNVSLPLPSRLPYFLGAVLSYFAGLVATYVALTVFKAAQPALLYLVPSCLLTALAMAAVKGELSQLMAYTEEETDEKSDKQTDEKDDTSSTVSKQVTESEVTESKVTESEVTESKVTESEAMTAVDDESESKKDQ